MKPYQLTILRGFATALWTIGTALAALGLAAGGNESAAIHCYALSIFVATIAAILSVWLIGETMVNRTADRLRDELADAVGVALRDHIYGQQERHLYVTRR